MNSDLKTGKCEACRADSPPVTDDEKRELLPQIPEWRLMEQEGEPRLERVFKLQDYLAAVEFALKVAQRAEEVGHHPAMLLEWGKVTVWWWTHKIHNLHRNDFIMAAQTDDIFQREG